MENVGSMRYSLSAGMRRTVPVDSLLSEYQLSAPGPSLLRGGLLCAVGGGFVERVIDGAGLLSL